MEAVDSTYGCVLLRGQILTATKNWWGLHPDEIVLIMNYLLSEIPAVLKDTPVFLPVKSPTVSCLKAENIYTFPREKLAYNSLPELQFVHCTDRNILEYSY